MPNDNVMPHQQLVDNQTASAQNNLAGSIPQAPNASGPSAQDILSQVLGGQSQQAPSPIAPPTPTPAAPQPTMWSKFLQNALSGLAGGLSAPSGSSDGGALGYKFAQDAEAKRQADAQNAQASQDKQNQQQFTNQLAANQDQRAQQDQLQQGQMSKYQLATANLNLMNQAQTLANAPEEARANFYKGQSALTEQYRKDKAPEVAVIDDDDHHGNLTAFFASHPDRTALNTVFTHTDDGKIHVFAPIGLKGDQLNDVARKAGVPATYNADTQYTPEQTTQIQNTIQKQAFEAGQAKLKERGENGRAALAHSAGPSANDTDTLAHMLVNHQIAPSELSKKQSGAVIAKANDIAMQSTGRGFDVQSSDSDHKFATNVNTQNTLKYLNSLTGADNKSGNLGQLIELSKGLNNTRWPALNDKIQWAKLEAGDPKVAAFHASVTETADQVAKILQGGGSGTSDAKMKQASEMFRDGFNSDQMTSVAETLRGQLGNRKKELVGSNPYLQRDFGAKTASVPQGATHIGKGSDGKSYYTNAKGQVLGSAE